MEATEEAKPSSVPALGLGLAFVGAFIVMMSGTIFLISLLIPEVPDIPNIPYEDNPFTRLTNLTPVWGAMIVYGLLYIYAAMNFREFKLWAHRTIIALSALLPVIVPIELLMVLGGIPQTFVGYPWVTIFFAIGIPAAGLIWFITGKNIRPHFI